MSVHVTCRSGKRTKVGDLSETSRSVLDVFGLLKGGTLVTSVFSDIVTVWATMVQFGRWDDKDVKVVEITTMEVTNEA